MVRLANADELAANLPLSGGAIAAKIGAELQRGTTIDIAMVTVGKKRTTWTQATRADLKGSCEGATHYVRGATVGAFVLGTGTSAKVRTAAEVFGVGASAGSESSKDVQDKEGDPADCTKSSPDSKTAPAQCGAAVRLELVAIPPAPPADAKEQPKPPEEKKLIVAEEPCPQGLVLSEGKCTSPASSAPHLCDPSNAKECQEQCDKGHAGSCGVLGALYGNGTADLARDASKAAGLFQKACDGGDAKSCVNLGEMKADGVGGSKDPTAAAPLFEKACNDGEAHGCLHLGELYRSGAGVSKDDAKAAALLQKGCDGGQARACGLLGKMYAEGAGVAKDDKQAGELLGRACNGNDGEACDAAGELSEKRGDAIRAGMMYQRGCWTYPKACANHGRILQSGPVKNEDLAKMQFSRACNFRVPLGCAVLKVVYKDQRPFIADPRETMALQSSCNAGSAKDCAILGIMQVAGGQPMGKQTLERACNMNERWACELKKH
jgi:hypothetical protein